MILNPGHRIAKVDRVVASVGGAPDKFVESYIYTFTTL